QIAVTVGMLIWVFHDPNQRAKMAEALRTADYRWVGAGILSYVLVEVFAAFRWQILLRVQKIRLSFPRVAGLFFIGMFYNQFLPGGTGGDIIKSYLLLKETPDKKAGALLAVVFDRLIGLVALVAITVTLVSLRFDILSKSPETRRLLWILLFLLGSSITALPISFAGLGLREQILQVMLHNVCHASVAVSKLIGTMGFLIIFLCCLPGGIVYFFYKPSGETRHVRMREMETEVATLEHEIG